MESAEVRTVSIWILLLVEHFESYSAVEQSVKFVGERKVLWTLARSATATAAAHDA